MRDCWLTFQMRDPSRWSFMLCSLASAATVFMYSIGITRPPHL
jgi:hypothetical protein